MATTLTTLPGQAQTPPPQPQPQRRIIIQQIPCYALNEDNLPTQNVRRYEYHPNKDDCCNPWIRLPPMMIDKASDLDDKVSNTTTTTTTSSSTVATCCTILKDYFSKRTMIFLLLPAQYPKSVSLGYLPFASYCFMASVCGSAAMVLSTQTLLFAVGIIGSSNPTSTMESGIMAGAFNWVMKDFVGQLGGVVFASAMGQSKALDSDPKRWRMTAAMALDVATLLEILSPLFPSTWILPVASIANISKNVGFLTASASRAALHQSFAISGNLGDITAKAGSQSIMASLIGTSVGIGLSSSVLQHDTMNFVMGFVVLSMFHQGCNYLSLQHVPLNHFNMQRLSLVVQEYIASNYTTVWSPNEISKKESFFPLMRQDQKLTKDWLQVGRPLPLVCPHPQQLEMLLEVTPHHSPYLLSIPFQPSSDDDDALSVPPMVDVIFLQDATGEDVVRGVYHAWVVRTTTTWTTNNDDAKDKTEEIIRMDETNNNNKKKTMSRRIQCLLHSSYHHVDRTFPALLKELHDKGWNTSLDRTSVESGSSTRISLIVKEQ